MECRERWEDLRFLGRKGGEETTKREREKARERGGNRQKRGKEKERRKVIKERMIDTDIEDRMGELNIRSNF